MTFDEKGGHYKISIHSWVFKNSQWRVVYKDVTSLNMLSFCMNPIYEKVSHKSKEGHFWAYMS